MPRAAPHVLLVDDNARFLAVLGELLASAAHPLTVHAVTSGSAALAFLERRAPHRTAPRPACVVLDFHLPDLAAPQLLRCLAGDAALRDIPVLVLSQADWQAEAAQALAAGAAHFHLKPSRVRALRDAVVTFCEEAVDGGARPGR